MRARARLDESVSLRRQSMLIALLCAAVDVTIFYLVDVSGHPLAPVLLLAAVAILLVDLALALPAPTAGWVALAHGVVRCGVGVLLVGVGDHDDSVGNAVGLVLAGYRAGAWLRGRESVAALSALMIGMSVPQWMERGDGTQAVVGALVLTMVANTFLPWLMGRYTTARSGYIDEVERKAEAARTAAAETLAQERGAIARDLHDTISHHVAAIGVHAAAARLGLPAGAGPDPLRSALGQVENSSLAAMSDLRRMLDLLHDPHRDGVQQPGLRNLDELLDGARRTGLDVSLQREELNPTQLPGSIDVAAYRVVQEILTNALRHGSGEHLDLLISQDEAGLVIAGHNPVPPIPPPSSGTGRGLDGLRQRAGLFSGTFSSGLTKDGQMWSTTVRFPLETNR